MSFVSESRRHPQRFHAERDAGEWGRCTRTVLLAAAERDAGEAYVSDSRPTTMTRLYRLFHPDGFACPAIR